MGQWDWGRAVVVINLYDKLVMRKVTREGYEWEGDAHALVPSDQNAMIVIMCLARVPIGARHP